MRHKQQFVIQNGLLYKICKNLAYNTKTMQFILHKPYRPQVIKACHDSIGHLGWERSLSLPKHWFYWPNMSEELAEYIKRCRRFLHFKSKMEKAPLSPIQVMHLLELIHMDYLTVELGKGDKDMSILVVTDHFTCYARHASTPHRRQAWLPKHYVRSSWFIMACWKTN